MPRILIIGATGYLGSNLANLLVRGGQHSVYGIARSDDKAAQLAAQEIRPIRCADLVKSPDFLVDSIASNKIDIVVDVAGANDGSYQFLQSAVTAGQKRLSAYRNNGIEGPKLGFIYCSGTWVHGSSDKPVTDLDIVGQGADTPPPDLVAWRVDLENAILGASEHLDVMILRPALIYGRELTIWASFMSPLVAAARDGASNAVSVPIDPQSTPGLIHVDDTARAFECAIEKLPSLSGTAVFPVFDLVTSQESMRNIFDAAAKCLNFRGRVELTGPGESPFAIAMGTTFKGSSARAKQVLGWQPKRTDGFVRDMDLYVAAFVAAHRG